MASLAGDSLSRPEVSTAKRMSAAQADTLRRIHACKQQSTLAAKNTERSYRTLHDMTLSRNFSAPVLSVSTATRYVSDAGADEFGGAAIVRARGLIRRVDLSNALVRSFVCRRCRRSIPIWSSLVDLECAPTTQIHRSTKGGYSRTSRDHAFTDEEQRPPWDFVSTVAPRGSVPEMGNLTPFLYVFNAVPVHMVKVAAELAGGTPPDEYHRKPAILAPLKTFESFADLEESPYCIIPKDMPLFAGISPLQNAIEEDWIVDMGRLYTSYILPNLDLRDFATAPPTTTPTTDNPSPGGAHRVSTIQRDRPVWEDETRLAAHNTQGTGTGAIPLPGYSAFLDESFDVTPLGLRTHSARVYGRPAAAFETAPSTEAPAAATRDAPVFVPFSIFARTSDVLANKDRIVWGRARYTDAELAERAQRRRREREGRRRYAALSVM